ncbi:hypothetical protein D3C76_1218050 [compost metagenome]
MVLWKKIILIILLSLVSCILGASSCILVISIIMSSSNSLVTVKDTPLLVRSLFLLTLILVGYGSFLYWLQKHKLELILILNAGLFVISFFAAPYIPGIR